MKTTIAVLILAAASMHAQTATVIPLSPEDAQQAKTLYNAKADIETKIAEFNNKVEKQYTLTGCMSKPGQSCTPTYPYPWAYGFEFSKDFKFIVPKQSPPSACSNLYGSRYCNNDTIAYPLGTLVTPTSATPSSEPYRCYMNQACIDSALKSLDEKNRAVGIEDKTTALVK